MSDTNRHVLTGKVDITSNLLVGSSQLFVDTDNNRVGLVTTDPDAGLHVNSNAYVNTDLRVGSDVVINDSTNPGRITATEFVGDGSRLNNVVAAPGPPGDAATIEAGTTTTGLAGTSASVTNSGTTSAAVFDFTIPKGDLGIQGIQGIQGVQGIQGPSGTITVGTVTTVTNSSGASVTNSGTSENAVFNFNIPVGADSTVPGPQGIQGIQGIQGPEGLAGADGTNYFTLSGSDIYRSTGNVGIGTTSPIVKLQVDSADFTAFTLKRTGSAGGCAMGLYNANDDAWNIGNGASGQFGIYNGSTFGQEFYITSSGNVGIGTTSPNSKLEVLGTNSSHNTTIYPLTVSTVSSSSTEVLEGIGTGIEFRVERRHTNDLQNDCGAIRVYGAAGIPGTSDRWNMAFRVKDNDTVREPLTIKYNKNVGVGTTNPLLPLHVVGSAGGQDTGSRRYFKYDVATTTDTSHGVGGGIFASGAIITNSYFISTSGAANSSDRRIKTDITDIDDGEALDILRLIKPKRYCYKDTISRGSTPVYGFIAQEVKETLPHATLLQRDFLPNIYELSNVSQSNVITFTNFTTTQLNNHTSKIKLMEADGGETYTNIVEVIDDHTIRVDEDLTEKMASVDETGEVVSGNRIFVYGEEVDDFVFLKKEIFIPICVSSIQELDRRLEADKTRIVELETQLQSEKSKLATVELLVASLLSRVGDLEKRIA